MYKRIATAAAALGLALTVAGPASADAATVTHHQFNRLQLGEPRAHVQQKIETSGILLLADSNRFGQTRLKLYGVDGQWILAKYLKPSDRRHFVLISKQWCTGDGIDLNCA